VEVTWLPMRMMRFNLLCLCLALCVNLGFMFSTIGFSSRMLTSSTTSTSLMAETKARDKSFPSGRSKSEVGLTQKQMFQAVKKRVNTKAVEDVHFFDVGDGAPDITLYCKSNGDGTQIGDCPFAQFIQLVMLKKGLKYNIKPTLPADKPAWLVEKFEGKLPALVNKDVSMVDSLAIAEYIEKTFPQNSLTRPGAYTYQEVLEKTAGFFPALSPYIKNKDTSKDAELKAAVEAQLDLLDEVLRSTPGQYFCGIELTLADLYIVPQLYHAIVTVDHFKGWEMFAFEGEPTRPALEAYIARMLEMPEFNNKKAYYNVDQVVYGWKNARA